MAGTQCARGLKCMEIRQLAMAIRVQAAGGMQHVAMQKNQLKVSPTHFTWNNGANDEKLGCIDVS